MAEEEVQLVGHEDVAIDMPGVDAPTLSLEDPLAPPQTLQRRAVTSPTFSMGSAKSGVVTELGNVDGAAATYEPEITERELIEGLPGKVSRQMSDGNIATNNNTKGERGRKRRKSAVLSTLKEWKRMLDKRLIKMGYAGFLSSGAEYGLTVSTCSGKHFYFSGNVTKVIFKYFTHREMVLNVRGVSKHFKSIVRQDHIWRGPPPPGLSRMRSSKRTSAPPSVIEFYRHALTTPYLRPRDAYTSVDGYLNHCKGIYDRKQVQKRQAESRVRKYLRHWPTTDSEIVGWRYAINQCYGFVMFILVCILLFYGAKALDNPNFSAEHLEKIKPATTGKNVSSNATALDRAGSFSAAEQGVASTLLLLVLWVSAAFCMLATCGLPLMGACTGRVCGSRLDHPVSLKDFVEFFCCSSRWLYSRDLQVSETLAFATMAYVFPLSQLLGFYGLLHNYLSCVVTAPGDCMATPWFFPAMAISTVLLVLSIYHKAWELFFPSLFVLLQYMFIAFAVDKLGQFKTFTLWLTLIPVFVVGSGAILMLILFLFAFIKDRLSEWEEDGDECFLSANCWMPVIGFIFTFGAPTALVVTVHMAAAGSITWFPVVPIFGVVFLFCLPITFFTVLQIIFSGGSS